MTNKVIVVVCVALALLLAAAAILPCVPLIQTEQQLNADLQQWAQTSPVDTMPDYDVRGALQRLARTRKLHIPWENIDIKYDTDGKILGVGYALPLELPILYFILTDWVAVRFVSLPANRGSP